MKNWIKRNWSWIIVGFIAIIPLLELNSLIEWNFADPSYDMILFEDVELSEEEAELAGYDFIPGIKIALQHTGNWAVRFLLAVLLVSPFRIVFGLKSNLYFRQSLGICCGIFTSLHLFLFFYTENFTDLFLEWNLVLAFLSATLILLLTLTSNKRSMKLLKKYWKKLHRMVFLASILALIHVFMQDGEWILYLILLLIGLLVRMKPIRNYFESR